MAGRATRLPQKVLAAPAMAPHLEPPLAPEAAPDLFSVFQLLCGLVSIRISTMGAGTATALRAHGLAAATTPLLWPLLALLTPARCLRQAEEVGVQFVRAIGWGAAAGAAHAMAAVALFVLFPAVSQAPELLRGDVLSASVCMTIAAIAGLSSAWLGLLWMALPVCMPLGVGVGGVPAGAIGGGLDALLEGLLDTVARVVVASVVLPGAAATWMFVETWRVRWGRAQFCDMLVATVVAQSACVSAAAVAAAQWAWLHNETRAALLCLVWIAGHVGFGFRIPLVN